MHGQNAASACPCLRPQFGAIAVGLLKFVTGPLSVLGLYWTVYIFLSSDFPSTNDATVYATANGQEFHETVHYSLDVLHNIFYAFFLPAIFPLLSGVCVFIAVIKKNSKFLQWSLIFNLVFVASCVLVIILICCQGIKFLAILPLLAITMMHVYFLIVISLFKEWVSKTNYFSEDDHNPVLGGGGGQVNGKRPSSSDLKKRPAGPPPIPPPRGPRSILAHSHANKEPIDISGIIDEFQRTRVVTVTSV